MAHGARALARESQNAASRMSAMAIGHSVGGVIGGAVGLGLVAGLVGLALPSASAGASLLIVAGVGGVAIAADLQLIRLPTNRRMVRSYWVRTVRPSVAYLGYGFILGTGLMSYLPYYAVATALAWSLGEAPITGVLTGAAFGLGRTAAVWPLGIIAEHRGGLAQSLGSGQKRARVLSAALSMFIIGIAAVGEMVA